VTQFLLWFLGVPAALAVAAAVAPALEWAVWHAENFVGRCRGGVDGWRVRAARQSREQQDRAAFLRWLSAKAGADPMTGDVDQRVVEAQRQSELIHILVEGEVPKAVAQCMHAHRLMAEISGACHMVEIQFEPECYAMRARTVWLLGHTAGLVQEYPLKFDDPRLLHNAILLRKRALPTCRRCPYIELPVDRLPALCPTAELFQPQGAVHVPQ
jgi:hypothetical protein